MPSYEKRFPYKTNPVQSTGKNRVAKTQFLVKVKAQYGESSSYLLVTPPTSAKFCVFVCYCVDFRRPQKSYVFRVP